MITIHCKIFKSQNPVVDESALKEMNSDDATTASDQTAKEFLTRNQRKSAKRQFLIDYL